MFERFDPEARAAVVHAQELARDRGEDIGFEHLLLGAAKEGALADVVPDEEAFLKALHETLGEPGVSTGEKPRFSREGKKAMELSLREALREGSNEISPRHLFLGAMRVGAPKLGDVLEPWALEGVERVRIRRRGRGRSARGPVFGPAGTGNANVLLGIFDHPDSVPAKVLADLGVTKEMVEAKIAEHSLQSDVSDVVSRLGALDPDARRAAAARLRAELDRLEGEASAS